MISTPKNFKIIQRRERSKYGHKLNRLNKTGHELIITEVESCGGFLHNFTLYF